MKYCNFCGKEIDEKNLYGKGLFCNRSCQAKFNCKRNSEKRKGSKLKARFERTCKACGKPFEVTEAGLDRQFCSKFCSSHFKGNKKHPKSVTSKEQTASTLKQTLASSKKNCFERDGKIVYTNRTIYYCINCNKQSFKPYKTGYCFNCLHSTKEGISLWEKITKRAAKETVLQGKNKPWRPRNQKSFPEIFWKDVLEKNNISFEEEVATPTQDTCYFLDFKICKNDKVVDLEIDGGQHELPENIAHDEIRNKTLESMGYIIYRVTWNEVTSLEGKTLMDSKIQRFLDFYQDL